MTNRPASPPLIFAPQPLAILPVRDTVASFPIHRIYCVGRNYADHAVELGADQGREAPYVFLKSADCIVPPGRDFPYSGATSEIHHEIELAIALSGGGVDIPQDRALEAVFGYGVALDMTRYDLQAEAKARGRPWETAKSFECSAPCSEIVPVGQCGHAASARIWLEVNGEVRQNGDIDQMIWKVPEIIAFLSERFELRPGDLILSGTPAGAGAGAVQRGDRLHGGVDGISEIKLSVV
ncbi:MAG: fumarylacetoacetate hydrolase family protein [Hyphomicrobiales bacterium]|nr:fumarylacetoacetate hydrolase family protein [Hyphomicrobiales bacterium]